MRARSVSLFVLGICFAGSAALADCTTNAGNQFILYEIAGANSTTSCNINSPAFIDSTNDVLTADVSPATAVTLSGAGVSGNCWDTNFTSGATYDFQTVELTSQNGSMATRTSASSWIKGGTANPGTLYSVFLPIGATVCQIATTDARWFCKLCVSP